ncbi:Secapin-1 [Camponotus japonicus]
MRFYFLRRFLSVLLLLVSLICATQGSSLRTRRSSVLNDIGNALNNIGQTIKDTMKTRIDSMFHRHSTIEPETTEPILEPDWSGMTPDSRQIITAPIRCPPNHVIVKKRCRMISRRR